MDSRAAVVRAAGEGRSIAVVGDVYRFLATGKETNGRYALMEAIVPPGGGPPPHVHSREEEGFYVLEGEITFEVNGEVIHAGPGAFANMPIGSLHCFRNETAEMARMLITVSPAGLEEMFLAVGTAVSPGVERAEMPTPEEVVRLFQLAPEYGVEIRMPPPASS